MDHGGPPAWTAGEDGVFGGHGKSPPGIPAVTCARNGAERGSGVSGLLAWLYQPQKPMWGGKDVSQLLSLIVFPDPLPSHTMSAGLLWSR